MSNCLFCKVQDGGVHHVACPRDEHCIHLVRKVWRGPLNEFPPHEIEYDGLFDLGSERVATLIDYDIEESFESLADEIAARKEG